MISVQIDLSRTRSALAVLSRSVEQRSTIHRQVAAQLHSWVIQNFEQQGAKGERPWAPLKAGGRWKGKGRNRYFQTNYKVLQDTGNLRQSFAPFYDNNSMGVGAKASFGVDYAAAHEEGVPERNLPQRKMLPSEGVALKIASDIYGLRLAKLASDAGLSS